MEMILLDWTRMGKTYCLAGAVAEKDGYRIVRPILAKGREAPVRNIGWSPFLLDGHARWEVFELLVPVTPAEEPPHSEDLWVRAIRSCRRLAAPRERQVILTATMSQPGEPIFGAPLAATRTAAYLPPGTGRRSLATIVLAAQQIRFAGSRREGAPAADIRVGISVPEVGERWLPVKDHHLLARIEHFATNVTEQTQALQQAVRQMGDKVALRLGLSRPFNSGVDHGPAACWLMADGFFSLTDPQP